MTIRSKSTILIFNRIGTIKRMIGVVKEEYVRSNELRPVLEHWINVNHSIAKLWEWKDCPWWCGEQAAVSLLAAAVWKAGGMALAEYGTSKTFQGDPYNGRCDLYFNFLNQPYIAEAKYCFPLIGTQAEMSIETIKNNLDAACSNVRCMETEGERRLGMIFAVPCLHDSNSGQVDSCIISFQDELLKLDFAHIAWVFPPETRKLAWDKYLHPGIALLIQEV